MNTRITPLRYPGGKQKLAPFISEIITYNNLEGCSYIEPYAGGAGVALSLLVNKIVSDVFINDISKPIYAFWTSVFNQTERFVSRIRDVPLTVEQWNTQHEIFKNKDSDLFDLGFATFFMNRCNRSGILNAGIIGGKEQSGKWKINARFNRIDLINRIEMLSCLKDQIHLYHLDAIDFLHSVDIVGSQFIYLDPPYYNKANTLYENYYEKNDHEKIATYLNSEEHRPWVISYDYTSEVAALYSANDSFMYNLQYNAAKAYKGTEFFAFSSSLNIPPSSSLKYVNYGLQNTRGH